ncbi:MAG: hypothetical protein IMX01_01480 [Limnochordaceae bacterium]|nr:hypothetical protein [Limnochordaceae bacterium]
MTYPTPDLDDRVNRILASTNLEQKLGQLFMVGFPGREPDAGIQEWLTRCHLGSVALFAHNLGTPAEVLALTNRLQQTAADAGAPVPLFLAADQEGGIVTRLSDHHGFTAFPGNMALGAIDDPQLAYQVARVMADEMRAVGINFNLAPVLDVNNNPRNPVIGVRSYGEDPVLVARLGVAQIRGFQQPLVAGKTGAFGPAGEDGAEPACKPSAEEGTPPRRKAALGPKPAPRYVGVVATAKHFPGHGDTAVDSHQARPVIPHARPRLDAVELLPFRAAIAADVAAIMTAHVSVPALEPDPHLPATLSSRVITGLLRQELGFEGLVVTDSLGMRGVSAEWSFAEAAIRALEAGCDLLCASSHTYFGTSVYDAVLAAVRSGRLAEERIEASVRRVLRTKLLFGLSQFGDGQLPEPNEAGDRHSFGLSELVGRERVGLPGRGEHPRVSKPFEMVGSAAHREMASRVAHRALTLVRGPAALPLAGMAAEMSGQPGPVQGSDVWVVEFAARAQTGVEDRPQPRSSEPVGSLAQLLEGWSVHSVVLPLDPTAQLIDALLARVALSGGTAGLHDRPPATRVSLAVVATQDAVRNPGQAEVVRRLAQAGVDVRVVCLRNPYELAVLPNATTFLVAFSPQSSSLEAVAACLQGKLAPTGRLPVTIPQSG